MVDEVEEEEQRGEQAPDINWGALGSLDPTPEEKAAALNRAADRANEDLAGEPPLLPRWCWLDLPSTLVILVAVPITNSCLMAHVHHYKIGSMCL